MRQVLILLLVFFYSFSAIVPEKLVGELVKLPTLVSHYQKHKTETPTISVFSFLWLHYSNAYQQHSSSHNHDNLPLKNYSIQVAFATIIAVLYFRFSEYLFSQFRIFTCKVLNATYLFIVSSPHLVAVWQPPRFSSI